MQDPLSPLIHGQAVIEVPETQHQQPVPARGSSSRAIAVTCSQHGATGFTNLMVSKRDAAIALDPHSAGSCAITLDATINTATVLTQGDAAEVGETRR